MMSSRFLSSFCTFDFHVSLFCCGIIWFYSSLCGFFICSSSEILHNSTFVIFIDQGILHIVPRIYSIEFYPISMSHNHRIVISSHFITFFTCYICRWTDFKNTYRFISYSSTFISHYTITNSKTLQPLSLVHQGPHWCLHVCFDQDLFIVCLTCLIFCVNLSVLIWMGFLFVTITHIICNFRFSGFKGFPNYAHLCTSWVFHYLF